jgi:hypothetical protein
MSTILPPLEIFFHSVKTYGASHRTNQAKYHKTPHPAPQTEVHRFFSHATKVLLKVNNMRDQKHVPVSNVF